MIPLTGAGWQSQPWQWHLSHAVTDINELVRLLDLDEAPPAADFPLMVPLPWLARIERGNRFDPLLLQIMPSGEELVKSAGYALDPLEEMSSAPIPGLIHKYHGRVLVIVSGACAVNCRYCFRRHFPYQDFKPGREGWLRIAEYVAADPTIREVILSGGDPLVLSDSRLQWVERTIAGTGHVDTLRLHTRLPVVIPQRVCDALLEWIGASPLRIVMVVHCNHAREIDASVERAMRKLAAAGVVLLNQSVLLRGINDSASAISDLSRRLFEAGVMPYYLHLLDPVQGVAHFDVPEVEAVRLMAEVAAALPGYLVPKLVREIPGEAAKRQLFGAREATFRADVL